MGQREQEQTMPADDPGQRPYEILAELIITGCDALLSALRGFANAYLDVLADDVSQAEREHLSRAADLIDKALDEFSETTG
jgi:hypothetical protein